MKLRDATECFKRLTPEADLAPAFTDTEQLVVCGQTHMQFDWVVAGVRAVDAGREGMSFGESGARACRST